MISTLLRQVVRTVLPNGLTLLVLRNEAAPVVAIHTHVKAGYFDEPDDQVGISHVVEHMYFKGTPSRGVGEIARETKLAGGYLNAHTIYDHTSYFTVLPSGSFREGLAIQHDAFANSLMESGELARELEVIIQEARRKSDTPSAVAVESLYALLHDRHRIRRWRIGDEESLRGFTRAMVHGFYRNWYTPGNTILSIVGDIDPDTALAEVERLHGALPPGEPLVQPGEGEQGRPGFRSREWEGDIGQQHTVLGWRTPGSTDADTAALDLAATALSAGRASRLYRAIRERQLALGVSAWNMTSRDVGVFSVQMESPLGAARGALTYAWQEIMSAREAGFRNREIVRAQRIAEARWLRRLESAEGIAAFLASWEAEGGVQLAAEYADRFLSLGQKEVQEAMQRWLNPLDVAIVGYRPLSWESLADDSAGLARLLDSVDQSVSSVLPPPEVPTPSSTAAITAPALASALASALPRLLVPESTIAGVHQFRNARGVPILTFRRHGSPLVHLGVFQLGGSAREPAEHAGLMRLMAQTMLKGTEQRTGSVIAESMEELGGSIGVAVSADSVSWTVSVPLRHVREAVTILADVVQHAIFPVDAIETERRLAVTELGRMRDDMYRWPMRLARRAAYGQHPYARVPYGTEASLADIPFDLVREFHARHVLSGSTTIALAGDIDELEAASLLDAGFDNLSWRSEPVPEEPVWPAVSRVEVEERERQQTAIALLFNGAPRSDPRRFAAQLLAAIASGLGGRFFDQLRDKQSLAYTVLATPVERRSAGAFATYIATSPEREEEARSGLLKEFAKLAANAPVLHEMERARNYLIGSHQIARQSGASVLAEIVDAWFFGSLGELESWEESISEVSGSDVLRFAMDCINGGPPAEGIVRGIRG